MTGTVRNIARLGMLCAIAIVLSYLEQLLPAVSLIPGIKLGLGNAVVLYAVYTMGAKSAVILMLLKVFAAGFLFSGPSALLYSLAGGLLSLAAMIFAKRLFRVSVIGVSIVGAVFHNVGQAAIACAFIAPRAVLAFLPLLLIAGVVMGALTGIIAKLVLKYISFGRTNA